MKSLKLVQKVTLVAATLSQLVAPALASDGIIHPYSSARGSAMGGVFVTTGLYEENLYGNPARAMANPRTKVTLLDLTAEVNGNVIANIPDLTSGVNSETIEKIGAKAGQNNHLRLQMGSLPVLPAIFIASNEERRWALGIQLFNPSLQLNANVRRSYLIDPNFVLDAGIAVNYARRFLADDALAVGLTAKFMYRMSSNKQLSFIDILQGRTPSVEEMAGDGSQIGFDLGATYKLPWAWNDFVFDTGLVISNIPGGAYSTSLQLLSAKTLPLPQPMSLGFGASAKIKELWKFTDFVLALEFSDINNNAGSMFRTVHLGTEARYGVLKPRLGLNQGYWTAGLGLDLKYFTLDLSTYGEEMSLVTGAFEDRRFALKFAFQI